MLWEKFINYVTKADHFSYKIKKRDFFCQIFPMIYAYIRFWAMNFKKQILEAQSISRVIVTFIYNFSMRYAKLNDV